ncbi:hypothetical protein [Candidatus Electronema sp. PJ]|uniref:hypothetical protein n=1 Tax=Candidatus Electronema sp. PJ TaxID=3401572 RepID=UPI003AA880CB
MTRKNYTYLLATLVSISSPALAAQPPSVCVADCGDSSAAVSSLLLAAGMYGGVDGASAQGVDFSLNESAKMFKGVFAEQGPVDGQDITLSYSGSEGRLGLSAGYLYTAPENRSQAGIVLFGLDEEHSRNLLHDDNEKPWYVTLNVAKNFQISDSLALGVDSRTMLITPSLQNEEKDSQAVCMSFNLPVSYGKFLTVTPELQWSRALEAGGQAAAASSSADASDKNPNTFYGGMSISFSY